MHLNLDIKGRTFAAELEKNDTAQAFAALLPMTLSMTELNGNEKYHDLWSDLPHHPERVGQIHAGDLMLFGGNCVVLFYEDFSTPYSYTRIGRVTNPDGLRDAMGRENVRILFELQ